MRPDDNKKWGTIYLDASREATMDKLDAMQAATRQEQWNQRTQQDYLEKVRAKATERAREILGEAYTERQRVLDEARQDAVRIRMEAQSEYALAAEVRQEAEALRVNVDEGMRLAEELRATAQERGFNDGLEQAQEELESFRAAIGASVGGVLTAIHEQCGLIFEGWRQDLVELLKVCVEKGTGLVLDEHYSLVMEHLVLEAVRQLDDRRCITLRVHPDDEAAVADMFAAARERLPNIGQWMVQGDPSMQLGGLIAESQSGTVDSRLELHRALVENILQHLALPGSALDAEAMHSVEEAMRLESERIATIAPPLAEPAQPEAAPAGAAHEAPPDAQAVPGSQAGSQASSQADPEANLEAGPESTSVPPAYTDAAQGAAQGPAAEDLLPHDAFLPEDIVAAADQGFESNTYAPAPPVDLERIELPPDLAARLEQQHGAHSAQNPLPAVENAPPLPAAQTVDVEDMGYDDQPPSTRSAGRQHEPSRAELEEELFDLPDPPQPTPMDGVLAQGGFLDNAAAGERKL